jgi:plasmid maintenance system antidote protein VapI
MKQPLNAKQNKYIELRCAEVYNGNELAKILQVSRKTINEWAHDKRIIDKIQEIVEDKFKELAGPAQRKLVELMNSKADGVALNACKAILDYAGYIPVQKSEVKNQQINISLTKNEELDEPKDVFAGFLDG